MSSPPRDCPDCDYTLEEHRSSEQSIMAVADACSLTQEELKPASYTCRFCQAESHNSNDVMMRYCGACGRYDDEASEAQLVHSKEEFERVFGEPPQAFLDDTAFLTSKQGSPRALAFARAIANNEPVDPKEVFVPTDTETLKNLFKGPMAPKVAWLAAAADDCWEVIDGGARQTPPTECVERVRQVEKAAKLLNEAAECLKRADL